MPAAPAAGAEPAADAEPQETDASARKSALASLVARKRASLKQDLAERHAAEESTTERWSGLRITNRCIRQEKWDSAMRGKELISFRALAGMRQSATSQVLIGVLCAAPLGPRPTGGLPGAARCAEWVLTDLDISQPQTARLLLYGRALDHWACPESPSQSGCPVGTILAVLNPAPTRRASTIAVSMETQLLKLGLCPALKLCDAKDNQGRACGMPFNAEGFHEFCSVHARMSHGARQAGKTPRAAAASRGSGLMLGAEATPQRKRAAPLPLDAGLTDDLAEAARCLSSASAAVSAAAEGGGSAGGLAEAAQRLEALPASAATLLEGAAPRFHAQLADLAERPDDIGAAARRLRRAWRALLLGGGGPQADAGSAPPAGEIDAGAPKGQVGASVKRAR